MSGADQRMPEVASVTAEECRDMGDVRAEHANGATAPFRAMPAHATPWHVHRTLSGCK